MKHAIRSLTERQVFALPDPEWLIEQVLPENGLGVLYGPRGCGKSFLALDIGLSVSEGLQWLHKANVAAGPVAYIVAEGRGGLKFRLKAWRETHPTYAEFPTEYILEPVQFLQAGATGSFLKSLREQPKLIIVDTLARCFAGGDENETKDMNQFVAEMDRIRRETGGAVLVVHHTGRAEDAQDRPRGNTALDGAADSMFLLKPSAHHLTLSCTKQKDAEEFKPFRVRLQSIDIYTNARSMIVVPDFVKKEKE